MEQQEVVQLLTEGAWRQRSIHCHIVHRENELVHFHNTFENLLIDHFKIDFRVPCIIVVLSIMHD